LTDRNFIDKRSMTRRDCVRYMGAALGYTAGQVACAQETDRRSGGRVRKPVAAITTGYHKWWHPDVILGKIFEGWKQDDSPGPALQLVSMYVDQPALIINGQFCLGDTKGSRQ